MSELKLNIYNDNGEVAKTIEAKFVEIKMGTIRKLMKLIQIDDLEDTASLLKTVYVVWDELTKILDEVFPGVEEEEWDYVNVSELIPVLIEVLKGSFTHILKIPNNSKN